MKLQLTFYTIITLFIATSCSENNENAADEIAPQNVKGDANLSVSVPKVNLKECIQNALYFLDNTDISTYDSIDTHYFHEVLGYTDNNLLDLEERMQMLKHSIVVDTLNNIGTLKRENIELEIENIRYELYSYEKEVIGYVFIHTYSIKSDTLSAIIVMNKNCSSSQAIPVNAIKDIDPSDYSYKVKQIESSI